jgi:O-Antigen ligase
VTEARQGEAAGEDALGLRPGELPPHRRQEVKRRGALLDRLGGTPELIPGLAAVAVFVFWAGADAAVLPTDSYPGAVLLLGLLAVTVYAYRGRFLALPQLVLAAVALLAAFALWNLLSILWADDQGAAWDGANRCLTYLTVFILFALPPWRSRAAALLLGLYTAAIGVMGLWVLLDAAQSSNPAEFFVAGRFAEPTGYHNANAALFTGAIFPAIFLASSRESPWPVRGLMLALAGVLFQLALMPQSRGWLIAAPLALLAYLALVPGLVRSLITLAPLAAVAALTAGPVLDVFDAVDDPAALGPALDSARDAVLIGAIVLFAVGAAIGFAERRLQPSERVQQMGSRAVLAIAGVVALGGVIVALAVIGNPVSWAGDRWDEFRGGEFEHGFESSRLGQGLGSNRYDFWRVAADEFTDSPLVGVGSNNFAEDYVRERDSDEEPAYSHNLPLSVLSETGLVGGTLFLGFLVTSLIGVARVRLRSDDLLARGVAGVAAAIFVYWFLHSTGDWFWALPALTAPVFAWLGLGMRVGAERARPPQPRWARRVGTPAAIAAGGTWVLVAISLVLPWIAAVDVKKAGEIWGADPRAAFDRLDRASDLNFLSANPDLVEGAIASRLNQPRRMRAAFTQALDRDPRNWYATLELAALDAVEGDTAASLERLDRVAELNPRESLTEEIRQGLLSGNPVTLAELDSNFLERYCRVHGEVLGPKGCETP